MSDKPSLQFEKAEFTGAKPPSAACAGCGKAITDSYWEAGGNVACERCHREHQYMQTAGSGPGRFASALLWGTLGGAVGAGIWYAVRAFFHLEVGLIAIVVGVLVGGGVKKGSNGRGGWLYQLLAVFLTYTAIACTNLPEIVTALRQAASEARGGAPANSGLIGWVVLAVVSMAFAYAAPFLEGFSNIIGILIIGIALYEAWKINKPSQVEWSGPYRLAERAPVASPAQGG